MVLLSQLAVALAVAVVVNVVNAKSANICGIVLPGSGPALDAMKGGCAGRCSVGGWYRAPVTSGNLVEGQQRMGI